MNELETAELLAIASGFDRFIEVDAMTTRAWFLALRDVPYALAEAATVAHFTGPKARETFGVRHVLDAVAVTARTTPDAVEEDVRSAKARGLIEQSWPKREPLPRDVRDALFTLRETERRLAAERYAFDQLGAPLDVGSVGRLVS